MKMKHSEKVDDEILEVEAKEEDCVYLDFGDIFAR